MIEQVTKDAEKQRAKLASLQKDLEDVRQAADAAQEAQRRATQGSLALSEENLEEYRRLCVLFPNRRWVAREPDYLLIICVSRKAQASVLAVAERQSLETLSRDEKTAARALAQAKDKQEQLNAKKVKLVEDEENAKRRRVEVSISSIYNIKLVVCIEIDVLTHNQHTARRKSRAAQLRPDQSPPRTR